MGWKKWYDNIVNLAPLLAKPLFSSSVIAECEVQEAKRKSAMDAFPVRRVDRRLAQAVEPQGSKQKFWFCEEDRQLLFKAEDRGTGEDWAEVVASHLCSLLGLPHVEYELAKEYDGEQYLRPGVVCANMAPKPFTLVLGNQLLLALDSQYPQRQRFKVRQHTVEAVSETVRGLRPPTSEWMADAPAGIESALDTFVGYVMLDAWIANQDRHHENWGALRDSNHLLYLAPTFDHGAALARNLSDSERRNRLTTQDRNQTVAAFASRGRSTFYCSAADQQPLKLREAFRAFAEQAPEAAKAWLARLRTMSRGKVSSILKRVPRERMSDACEQFTLELLMVNQECLLELGKSL